MKKPQCIWPEHLELVACRSVSTPNLVDYTSCLRFEVILIIYVHKSWIASKRSPFSLCGEILYSMLVGLPTHMQHKKIQLPLIECSCTWHDYMHQHLSLLYNLAETGIALHKNVRCTSLIMITPSLVFIFERIDTT